MRYFWPLMWLLRYLLGFGGEVTLPQRFFTPEVIKTLLYLEGESEDGYAYWHDTRLYTGEGFWGRPILFYLIGCFTAKVERLADGVKISLEDVYDWHPSIISVPTYDVVFNNEDGRTWKTFLHEWTANKFARKVNGAVYYGDNVDCYVWYCSAIPQWLLQPLNHLFPRYFVLSEEQRWKYSFNDLEDRWEKFIGVGISNELWMVSPLAKPFTSFFSGVVPYPPEEE